MDDVRLPPWAQGDAFEFVRIHREALESDYVSEVSDLCETITYTHSYVNTCSYLLACIQIDVQYDTEKRSPEFIFTLLNSTLIS